MKSFLLKILNGFIGFVKKTATAFGEWLSKDFKNIVIVVLILLGTVFFINWRCYEKLYMNKVSEMNDTVSVYNNKLGEEYSKNRAYLTDISNLKLANEELYSEVKSLKENPIIVTKINTVIQRDSIFVKDTVYMKSNNVYASSIKYSDEWCNIDGNVEFDVDKMVSECSMNRISFENNLTLDLIESGDDLSFIVKSDNPYCKINNIYGAVVSPEKSKVLKQRTDKKWCVVAGIGPSFTIVDNTVKVYPSLQLTLGYKLFAF